eukprot:1151649-Pelagomonas_calceolata.AAC.3
MRKKNIDRSMTFVGNKVDWDDCDGRLWDNCGNKMDWDNCNERLWGTRWTGAWRLRPSTLLVSKLEPSPALEQRCPHAPFPENMTGRPDDWETKRPAFAS